MGHAGSKQDYLVFQQRIDKNPIGAPSHPALLQIIEELFTPEECRLASAMPLKLSTASRIARISGVGEKKAAEILQTLVEKGLVVDFPREGRETSYYLNPAIIGFFEFTMMRVRDSVNQKRVAELMWEYMRKDPKHTFARMLADGPTYIARPLVHEDALEPEVLTEVLDWEKASYYLENTDSWAQGLCHCRHVKHHLGDPCRSMPMDHCLSMGFGAEYLIRAGIAQRIDKARAFEILEHSREQGSVQMCDNVKSRPTFICNCCKCCCEMMAGFRLLPDMTKVITSNSVAATDEVECNGCGKCARACPIDCIEMIEAGPTEKLKNRKKRAIVKAELCLGCGVCHRSCKFKSLTMKRVGTRVYTPENTMEKLMVQALERGKLQNLLFDDPTRVSHRTLSAFLGAVLKLPPVKQALARDQLKSKFIGFMVDGLKRTKDGWVVKYGEK
jgi:ferredoxin